MTTTAIAFRYTYVRVSDLLKFMAGYGSSFFSIVKRTITVLPGSITSSYLVFRKLQLVASIIHWNCSTAQVDNS